jgi:hypothetical protein
MSKEYVRKRWQVLMVASAVIVSSNLYAAEGDDKSEAKTIAQVTSDAQALEGFLTLYQDQKDGSLRLLVKKEQLDTPFLYFAHTENGALDAGTFKGAFRETKVLNLRKHFNKIEFVTQNTKYFFDENNAVSRSSDSNISPSVLATANIIAENESGDSYLIDVDKVLLSEALHKVSPNARPGEDPKAAAKRFKVGGLSKDKNKVVRLKNYPQNTDVVVEYVFENEAPTVRGGQEITDPRNVSVRIQHSFIALPENDFVPRKDDARIGYFGQQITDLTSKSVTPYNDIINRWNLVKKNPNQAVSEPVKPITWWIENTTPVEYRDTIRDAVLAWNIAFEKAGFRNAVEVRVQPDDAGWDAGDILYNVLRWTSSPRPPFGGYGPSLANPLTGEIIGADIMLEYSFITNRLFYGDVFQHGLDALEKNAHQSGAFCSLGHELHTNTLFATQSLASKGATAEEKEELTKQSLYFLLLHEVGHTLGLNHNMKSSQLNSLADIHNKDITGAKGLIGSVMDYPAVNIAPEGIEQGDYYTQKPGPYDDWAIEYGYSTSLDNPQAEEARLNAILARSTEPQLAFGNDADDMRSPGKGIDPRVMIGDLTSDAIGYAEQRYTLVEQSLAIIKEKFRTQGESHQELLNAYLVARNEFNVASRVTSRYIGGIYIDRGFVGQSGANQPYTPVSYDKQKQAMQVLKDNLFSPTAFSASEDVYAHLQHQRRGFGHGTNNEDPNLHQQLLDVQKDILNHLLHKNVMRRISDSRLYGNEYSLVEFVQDLTDAIFKEDAKGSVNTRRQNLQIEYVNRLVAISGLKAKSSYDHLSQSAALYQLQKIQQLVASSKRANDETKAHRAHISHLIESVFYQPRR